MNTSKSIQSNESKSRVNNNITQTEGVQIGDKVRHNKHEEVATVTAIREAFVNRCDGYRYLYTLDFGQSVRGPFGVELNGGEFLREAFTPCTPDGRDLLPECADNEEGKQLYRDTYRDCIDEVIRDVVSLQTNINGGRKGGWIDLDSATRIIGERIFIATKSNNAEYNSETVLREYVMEELCRLQDAGRIDATTNKHGQTIIKWTPERILAYIARCKELEAEALAQMPYKVGDTVTSCYGDIGRVIEMYPEVTGDTDSPHLIYEHDGKPFVSVVILDAEGKRHCANWSVYTLEPASEIKPADTQSAQDFTEALEIKEGDRVLSKHYGAMATVLGREYDHRRKVWYYRVEFDTPQKGMDGTERKVTEFKRYGITKNYYPQGTAEIVGNAIYYAEELQADYWGTDSKPRTIFDCEIFKPTDRRPLWILVADIFSSPKEMTLQQVAEYLARRYRESIALPEPPVEITLEDSGEITDEDKKANIDPRFTLNRYNISPASKYINDLGTMCANIRPEDDPEGERLGYCRYMTKKPGGEWTENRCMSWHSLEYSLYVFNAREMTFAESVEDRDGMEKPTDINCLAANIDRLLKRIASRGTAFAEVLSYIECYPDMGREFLNAMQCRDSLDHFRRWCAARQKHLRRKTA